MSGLHVGNVVITATREDADALHRAARVLDEFDYGPHAVATQRLVERIRDAIREQLPEPEPPKRWTVFEATDPPRWWLCDNGSPVDAFGNSCVRLQELADKLNAAEATS